jgi:hypothetical protein
MRAFAEGIPRGGVGCPFAEADRACFGDTREGGRGEGPASASDPALIFDGAPGGPYGARPGAA